MNENKQSKRLTRSRDDRFIGGVAAGIGQYLNVDPVFIRIAFVVSIIFGGVGAMAYLVLLATIPVDGDPNLPAPKAEGARRRWVIGGTIALGIATLALIHEVGFAGWFFGFAQGFWFGLLVWAALVFSVTWLVRESRNGPDAPAETPATETVTTTMAAAPTQNAPAGPPVGSAAAGPQQPQDDAPRTIGKIMTWFAIGLAGFISACVLAVISIWSTAVFGAAPMAVVVILLGIGLVVAALNDRHQLALWTLGAALAITIPMAIVSLADLRIEGKYGDVVETPVAASEIPGDGYQLAAGAMTIDLRGYPFRDGETVELPVKSGLGFTRVIVPDDVCVSGSVVGRAGIANVRGVETSGVDFGRIFFGGTGGAPELQIESELKLGAFEVIDRTSWRHYGPGGRGEGPQGQDWDGPWGDKWGENWDGSKRDTAAKRRAAVACAPVVRKPDVPNSPAAPSPPQTPAKPRQFSPPPETTTS